MNTAAISHGLEGVVAAATSLSSVDGEGGHLVIAGYPVGELAPRATFEEALYLLWNDVLPTAAELERFRGELAVRRTLSPPVVQLLREAARSNITPMNALRMAAAASDLDDPTSDERAKALMLVARFPVIVATYDRFRRGLEPLESRAELSHCANLLWLLDGEVPAVARVRALDTYLNTIIDHGMNASTFTARVIISTGSDLVAAVTGAIGALAGPLHGGAPGPVLQMLLDIGSDENIDPWLRAAIGRNERLMGFGHRIYKVRDPRADVLGRAAETLFESGGDKAFYAFARRVEKRALDLLEEAKPGRRLQTNVEFYTALLLHGIGLDAALFSPLFAVGRVGGWLAHSFEQRANNRIFRPESLYTGAMGRTWMPLEAR